MNTSDYEIMLSIAMVVSSLTALPKDNDNYPSELDTSVLDGIKEAGQRLLMPVISGYDTMEISLDDSIYLAVGGIYLIRCSNDQICNFSSKEKIYDALSALREHIAERYSEVQIRDRFESLGLMK